MAPILQGYAAAKKEFDAIIKKEDALAHKKSHEKKKVVQLATAAAVAASPMTNFFTATGSGIIPSLLPQRKRFWDEFDLDNEKENVA